VPFRPAFAALIHGVMGRVGTPEPVVQRIAAEVAAIVKEPWVIAQFCVFARWFRTPG
jgi:hypothetical protein